MEKNYFPILLTKAGEFGALSHLDDQVKQTTAPVFQVLSGALSKTEAHILTYWSFDNNLILLDFSLAEDLDIANARAMIVRLMKKGVNVVTVLQNNSSQSLLSMVAQLVARFNCPVCIKANNEDNGFINFSRVVQRILEKTNQEIKNAILLLDLGYTTEQNYNIFSALVINLIQGLPNRRLYMKIITASSSFPKDLSGMEDNRLHLLKRYEWDLWLQIKESITLANLAYSDYGTKYPIYEEVDHNGTCSIKYTNDLNYLCSSNKCNATFEA